MSESKSMTYGRVTIPWGTEQLSIDHPARWEVTGYCSPKGMPALTDVGEAVEQGLAQPREHPPLRELINPGAKVALVVDDATRPTPASLYIDRIIDAVESTGVATKDVTLVFALGLHRAMTEAEMCSKIGARAFGRVRCVNHNAYDANELTELGRTTRGTRIALNTHVAAADVRILVGCVEPHVQAGFGGGFKNILPGVAAADSIGHNHYLGASPTHFSMIAWMPHTNPMRQDIEEFGAALAGKTFAVNVVLNPDKQVVQVAAGNPPQVHLACINAVQTMYGVPVPAAADVVITSSAPLDVNLRQAVKGVANALFAARPNGIILALSRCELGSIP
jgi:nickel-dependent lactate racemase